MCPTNVIARAEGQKISKNKKSKNKTVKFSYVWVLGGSVPWQEFLLYLIYIIFIIYPHKSRSDTEGSEKQRTPSDAPHGRAFWVRGGLGSIVQHSIYMNYNMKYNMLHYPILQYNIM